MNKKMVEYIVYGVLALVMVVFAIYGLGIALSLEFATTLERSIVRDLGLAEFDLLVVAQLGLVVSGAILIGILVYLDEKGYRKSLRKG